MDPTISAMTLSRVEQNDPALTELVVSNFFGQMGNYWPNNSVDLARLGDAIGANTNLRTLAILSNHELADMAANNGAFSEGLKRNAFINDLSLGGCDLSAGMGREILNGFVVNNTNLTSFSLVHCALGDERAGVLASAITSCINLEVIWLAGCNIDDDILVELFPVIRGLHKLCIFGLPGNNVGRAGCEALATLLKGTNDSLRRLDLEDNDRIDDNCATIIANSLKGNHRMFRLGLSGNGLITENGWDAFSQVLCNTSSVNDTYCSDHTLINLGDDVDLPTNLSSLLNMNSGENMKQVAIQKILRYHTHLDMAPFLEWDLKVLPLAVSWFDRARDDAQNDELNVDSKKLSSIYQFVRALPMKFLPPPKKATNKRKIGEVNR